MSGAPQQRNWTLSKDQNPNREKARAIRARQRVIGRELRRIYDAVAQEPAFANQDVRLVTSFRWPLPPSDPASPAKPE